MNSTTPIPRTWHPLPEWFRDIAAAGNGAVLLETARFDEENHRTLLFHQPIAELVANTAEEIPLALAAIDQHVANGRYVAGFASYECGEHLYKLNVENIHELDSANKDTCTNVPFIRMSVFAEPIVFNHKTGVITGIATVPAEQNATDAAHILNSKLQIGEDAYAEKILRIQDYLSRGHSYQVNFTDRITGTFEGSPIALHRRLLQAQPVSYAAYIDCGRYQILSFSPELFYRTTNGQIEVRPMKGTWPRGTTLEEDNAAADHLRNDEKNRAEHVMIVDLLRNDIGKVCRMGSVHVDRLMEVEHYRTLLQLTSTITGTLDARQSPSAIFTALFPSGSITGAPKRRTMEIIRELEEAPRDVYTGAIGYFGPNGEACFNVAIRTLRTEQQRFTLGVGGGITVGSNAADEFAECKLKASFLHSTAGEFQLIETMRAEADAIPLLDTHLRRLQQSAAYFQIPIDVRALRNELAKSLAYRTHETSRVRLTLDERGLWKVTITPLDEPAWSGCILLSSERTSASDIFLHHKTTHRERYRRAFEQATKDGFDEVLFINSEGFITEGAISNIFLLIDGVMVTPDTCCGLLPGVYRQHILDTEPTAQSRKVSLDELRTAERIWFCNALRAMRPVQTLTDPAGNVLWATSEK